MDSIGSNIVNTLLTFNYRDLCFLLIGVSIGALIKKYTNILGHIKKFPVESILGGIIVYVVLCQFLPNNPNEKKSFDILNFIANMAFAWIMTKYSVRNEAKEKQKEISSISFRHSASIGKKLEYSIKLSELLQKQLKTCKCSTNNNECVLNHNILRIKDQLILMKQDSDENMNDWGNALSEELNLMKQIKLDLNRMKDIEDRIQELDESDEKNNKTKIGLEKKKKELNKEIAENNKKINHNIRFALDRMDEFSDAHIQKIQEQIDEEDVKEIWQQNDLFNKFKGLSPRNSIESSVAEKDINV